MTGTWQLVREAGGVSFSGRASRWAPVFAARFAAVTGTVHCAETTTVDVDVDLSSISTGNAAWDDLLAALDPFDVGRHPVATFRGVATALPGAAAGAVVDMPGQLTLRGSSAAVRLRGHCEPRDDGTARLRAQGVVNRSAFGLRLDLPGARLLVPAQMDVVVDVVAEPVAP
jgi:polyisoprenoid-binding protein YceI